MVDGPSSGVRRLKMAKSQKQKIAEADKKARKTGVLPFMGFADEMLKQKSPAEKMMEKKKKSK